MIDQTIDVAKEEMGKVLALQNVTKPAVMFVTPSSNYLTGLLAWQLTPMASPLHLNNACLDSNGLDQVAPWLSGGFYTSLGEEGRVREIHCNHSRAALQPWRSRTCKPKPFFRAACPQIAIALCRSAHA